MDTNFETTNFREVFYTKEEKDIINKGIESLKEAFFTGTSEYKANLLFCLDYYFDPYYTPNFPIKSEVIEFLQYALLKENNLVIQKDILHLLETYCNERLYIFEKNIDSIDLYNLDVDIKNRIINLTDIHQIINSDFDSVKKYLLNNHYIAHINLIQIMFSYIDPDGNLNLPYSNNLKQLLINITDFSIENKEEEKCIIEIYKQCIEELLTYLD